MTATSNRQRLPPVFKRKRPMSILIFLAAILSVASPFQAQRKTSSPTILHYSYDNNSCTITNNEEREAVDTYMEYVYRRYNRLYGDDISGIRGKAGEQKQQHQTNNPFPGANGLPSESDVEALKSQIGEAIQVTNSIANDRSETEMNHDVLMHTVLMPAFRALCCVQRQRSLFWKGLRHCSAAAISRTTGGFLSVPTTPRDLLDTLLDTLLAIGGGRRTMLRTMTIAYATAMVLRNQMFVAA